MSFVIKTLAFTGPFDLLLSLINSEKLSISEVNIAQVAEQYLQQMQAVGDIDLDVASDFVFVAATLLVLKSGYMLPVEAEIENEFFEEVPLSQEEALEFLLSRLVRYRAFRKVAKDLHEYEVLAAKKLRRNAPLPEEFRSVQPDHLANTTLNEFCVSAAHVFAKEQMQLLRSSHIAKKRISLAHVTDMLIHALKQKKEVTFSEALQDDHSVENVVVHFLALLDIVRQGKAQVAQKKAFCDISIVSEV